MAVTTADIAKRTGLSKMTISRVLNNHPYVREETRQRVLEVMKELGFQPNTLARRFFTGKTQLIGLIIPIEFMFSSFYFKDLCQGMLDCLETKDYDAILHNSKSPRVMPYEKCSELVKGKLVEGLLIASPMDYDEFPMKLMQEKVPLVVLGEVLHGDKVNRVGIPNRKAAREAVEHLFQVGHEKIGILHYGSTHLESRDRLQGCYDAFKARGRVLESTWVGEGEYSRSGGYKETLRLIQDDPEITAIFALNVDMAFGAYDAIHSLGLRVPDDISMISFDDCAELAGLETPMSAIRQLPQKVGYEAAKLLLEILSEKPPALPVCRLIETEYIERKSVAAPPMQRKPE